MPKVTATNYQILVPLRHILGNLKVMELVEGDFNCAMEVVDDSAVCFFFTKTENFSFMLGLSGIRFENKDVQREVSR